MNLITNLGDERLSRMFDGKNPCQSDADSMVLLSASLRATLAERDEARERVKVLEASVDMLPAWITCIKAERARQDAKWGEQDHDDLYWLGILMEEVGELAKSIIENDPKNGAKELIQSAAVCVAWMEAIDRRAGKESA